MSFASPDPRSRVAAAAATLALQALLVWALIIGLSVRVAPHIEVALAVFDVTPPVAPPKPPPPTKHRRPSGASAPEHVRASPTAVVAPVPVIKLPPLPPPIAAAPVAGRGADTAAGAADRGAGTGAGGEGNGLGNGNGNGGSGTGGGAGTPAILLRGQLSGRDYPRAAAAARIEGVLTTRVVVDQRGRVAECRVVRSSGNADLDDTTCRLLQQRLRYAPARDAKGFPTTDVIYDTHHWVLPPESADMRGGEGGRDDRDARNVPDARDTRDTRDRSNDRDARDRRDDQEARPY